MDLAVLADIHSNYIALERCMEYALARGIEDFLFLGDYIGEMAYPERTMALIYDYRERYGCTFIRGNKENYWMNYRAGGERGWREFDSTTGALWYAYHHLTDRDLDFFGGLPIARRLEYGFLPPLMACHGSPYSEREDMRAGTERAREILAQADTELVLCAHTHKQEKEVWQGRTMLNPGSVGHSLGAGGKSQFMILHGETEAGQRDGICKTGNWDEAARLPGAGHGDGIEAPRERREACGGQICAGTWREEFVTLDYDREEVILQLTESGLRARTPNWCRITEHSLRGGSEEIHHAKVLGRVMALCEKGEGQCDWPHIPEKYWEMAIKEFFP